MPGAAPYSRLDDSPPPDYGEYFDRAESLGLLAPAEHREVWIPFESARGCWWGAKHHCTFCGLNGTSMAFRAKSPERVAAELAEQARRYRSFRFEAVDNILDPRYLEELFPRLRDSDYELFYEVKANLSRAQLKRLAESGVRHIQPGLESLSTPVLRLMRKGVTAAQNVNVLRWAQHYGIEVSWNLLWGFPGERADDCAAQAALIPHLAHLRPPESAARIWLERFSPLYSRPEEFPVRHRRPDPGYRHVYPAEVDLEKVAYFFEHEFEHALPDVAYEELGQAAADWAAAWSGARRPVLTFWAAPGFVQIYDGRHPGREGTYTFHGLLADVYLACVDRPITATAVRARLGSEASVEAPFEAPKESPNEAPSEPRNEAPNEPPNEAPNKTRNEAPNEVPVEVVREALLEFAARGLIFLDGPRALALALPANHGR
ncbi:RiPP maturation radical SAM protein 1 [Nonomuraea sp. NN258]|nr:RiPP maturation radical SAM protein 1 [Nonomuraea antri]